MKLKEFKSVVTKYKTVFFDAYGVLKNHKGIIPGVENTFKLLEDNGINYFILTNDASRSPELLAQIYLDYGISGMTPDKIISSGMLARDWLHLKIKSGTLAYMGTEQSAHYIQLPELETIAIKDVDLDALDDINAVVLLDDEGFDWNEELNKVINLLRKKNVPVIIANTDVHYPVSKNDVAIAIGGLANLIEQIMGRHFIRFGKPDAQMFMYAYEKACTVKHVERNEILMVGDTLFTDIIGGNKFGMDTALVLSGNTLPDMAKIRIRSYGIIPTYVCENVLV